MMRDAAKVSMNCVLELSGSERPDIRGMVTIADGFNFQINNLLEDWTDPGSLFVLHGGGLNKIHINGSNEELLTWPESKR